MHSSAQLEPGLAAQLLGVHVYRGQGRPRVHREFVPVVEAAHRHIVRDRPSLRPEYVHDASRNPVGARDHRVELRPTEDYSPMSWFQTSGCVITN